MLPADKQGKRHFGAVIAWGEWENEIRRVEKSGFGFLEAPSLKQAGTDDEHKKAYLRDPSGNVVELKAYKNVERTLRFR